MSAYGKQFRSNRWIFASDAMSYAYQDLCSINSNKPVMRRQRGRWRIPGGRRQSAMVTEAFQMMKKRFHRLKAAVFWSERWENDGTYSNLRVTSSPERSKPIEEVWPTHSGWTAPCTTDSDPIDRFHFEQS
jgi:hypothetical protein